MSALCELLPYFVLGLLFGWCVAALVEMFK
jgi:hypothetical protein